MNIKKIILAVVIIMPVIIVIMIASPEVFSHLENKSLIASEVQKLDYLGIICNKISDTTFTRGFYNPSGPVMYGECVRNLSVSPDKVVLSLKDHGWTLSNVDGISATTMSDSYKVYNFTKVVDSRFLSLELEDKFPRVRISLK